LLLQRLIQQDGFVIRIGCQLEQPLSRSHRVWRAACNIPRQAEGFR
jgi:hypothetical protein